MKNATALLAIGLFSLSAASLRADELDVLGTAGGFAVLGAAAVTNTGPTTLGGNLGVYPGTSITTTGGLTVTGTVYDNGPVAEQAQSDALSAYKALAAMTPSASYTTTALGGTFTPGVYQFDSAAILPSGGILDLNFDGLTNQSIVFQIGSALVTGSGSSIDVLNEGTNDSIYFDVGSSATLGTTTAFQGTILADQSITLATGATIECGNALALNAAVTLDNNTVDVCNAPTSPIPEPGTMGMVATGTMGLVAMIRRKRYIA